MKTREEIETQIIALQAELDQYQAQMTALTGQLDEWRDALAKLPQRPSEPTNDPGVIYLEMSYRTNGGAKRGRIPTYSMVGVRSRGGLWWLTGAPGVPEEGLPWSKLMDWVEIHGGTEMIYVIGDLVEQGPVASSATVRVVGEE